MLKRIDLQLGFRTDPSIAIVLQIKALLLNTIPYLAISQRNNQIRDYSFIGKADYFAIAR